MYAAEAAQAGHSHDEIVTMVQNIIPKTQMYALITELDYLVLGGRLPLKLKKIMDFFKLSPLATLNSEGRVKPHRLFFGRKNLSEKLFKFIKKKIMPGKKYRFSIVHTDRENDANRLMALLKLKYAIQIDRIVVMPCCASLAVHAGPNALGIAIQEYA